MAGEPLWLYIAHLTNRLTTYSVKIPRSVKDLSNDAFVMFLRFFFFLIFFIKVYVVGTYLNCINLLHPQVHALQMGTHNIIMPL